MAEDPDELRDEGRARPDVAGWSDQFIEEVFPREYETVMERRREVTRRTAKREGTEAEEPPDRSVGGPLVPSVKLRLFGLAFSGGGIRSSTFNFGITQALAKRGLLPRFDYLSTVSGGGYIGSSLSSLLNRPEADSTWTKDFPFYLESGRQEPAALRHMRNNSEFLVSSGRGGYFDIVAVVLRGMLVNILAMLPFVIAIIGLTHWAYGTGLRGGFRAGVPSFALTLGALGVFLLLVAAFPLLSSLTRDRKNESVLEQRHRAGSVYSLLIVAILGLALIEALPLVLRWYDQLDGSVVLNSLTSLSVVGTVLPRKGGDEEPGLAGKLVGALQTVAISAVGPLLLLMAYLVLGRWAIFPGAAPFGMDHEVAQLVVYGGGAALFVYILLFLDSNATSIHQFYRDRISHAYLFQVDPEDPEAVRSTDSLRMSELNAPGTVAPYHLINTTLNLQGSEDRNLRGRSADSFIFSKHFTGSNRTGYCPTTKMEAADRHVNLGTAVAISGAAASPAMGTYTLRSLSLLIVLLNLRLGYWLINPRRVLQGAAGMLSTLGAGLLQLVTEVTSRADSDGGYVYVTDGAHLENLGMYELLRRRCRVIVCGDAEADPDMAFNGLSTIIRYAATDMGVHIDINLEGILPGEDGRSKRHHAIGKIDYGDGEVGWLLYIKLTIGERELPYIEEYRHANPDFPHQSTGDQFFDEAQFEAYRALGFKVGMRTLDALEDLKQEADDEELFDFSRPGAEVAKSLEPKPSEDPMESGMAQHFRPAADSEPPW